MTEEEFLALSTNEQNELVKLHIMGWTLSEWEEECSSYTPGATWRYGSEYYATDVRIWHPVEVPVEYQDYCDYVKDTTTPESEDWNWEWSEEGIYEWANDYGSVDFVTDIEAAIKMIEPMERARPLLSCTKGGTWHYQVISLVEEKVAPDTWCSFKELPLQMTVANLKAIGIIK